MKRLSFLVAIIIGVTSGRAGADSKFGIDHDEAVLYMKNVQREVQKRVPMRDGVSLNADVYFPAQPRKNLPTVLVRTPYVFGSESYSKAEPMSAFLKAGYAVVLNHERGRHFSEGKSYTFLNGAFKDGYDTVDWITKQPWSNGKVGTIGCSSSAEHQMGLAAMDHPGHAAMIPMAPGAGIGKIGPYQEQGNFYRGGAWQGFWLNWYYALGWRYRPAFPSGLTQETREVLAQYYDVAPKMADVDMLKAIWGLPLMDLPRSINAMPSDLDEFIQRLPNDPAWADVEFANEGDKFGVPSLWVFSWYDLPVAANTAFYNYQRAHAKTRKDRNNQFMVIGPTTHCQQGMETEKTIVGERDMGDARFDYMGLFIDWFDYWLKGEKNAVTKRDKIALFVMGKNKWQTYDTWPPRKSVPVTYFLNSRGGANSKFGDGTLSLEPPAKNDSDSFTYDPIQPVPSLGGSVCCFSEQYVGGAFDQSGIETRNDVLVYTTEPFKKGLEVTGPIEVVLYVSSDAKDTDLTVKLLDVEANGRAYNLDDSIQRVRYRNGYDKPVFMKAGGVYKVKVGPLATSNYFAAGHRLRVEISSSNFPRYGRNLNTGGNNYDESKPLVAHNVIHHSPEYRSHIVLPVVE